MNNKWVVLLILTGVLALLYLWFTLFPGGIRPEALTYFQEEQIIQGKLSICAPPGLYHQFCPANSRAWLARF